MSDSSSFLSITTLLWITGNCIQSCISRLVLSATEICGDMIIVDDTVWARDVILYNKRQPSDVIQNWSVGATRGRREKLTCFVRESWTWTYLQILLKSPESMSCSLRLLSMYLLQQNRECLLFAVRYCGSVEMCHQLDGLLEDKWDLGDVISLRDTQFPCVTHTGEPSTCTESCDHVWQRPPCLVGFVRTDRGVYEVE